ncbi:unnamed protein product [Moneuplotes crassus]|uniref:Protein kinase domain-containing protein n=1 Tax=Euplotes crassus TaxID=5936 RepID=A0AAD1U4C2_EUPCR|nr:unnamed protein product [Moneuplotes crassus]
MKSIHNYVLSEIIGKGAMGDVYQCQIKKNSKIAPSASKRMRKGRKVACKMVKFKNISPLHKKYLIKEIELLIKIQHDNIIRFLEAKKTSNNIYIFMELCNGGTLRRFLDLQDGKLEEELVQKITKQIAEGLNHLNENEAMHRDLKLDNILLNFPKYEGDGIVPDEYIEEFDHEKEEIEVIIGDLGFARSIGEDELTTSYCGTPVNMAPEIMNRESYNSKVDIWSLGTMIYELLVGFSPFIGKTQEELAEKVNYGEYGIPKNLNVSLSFLSLVNKCLQFNPEDRISQRELISDPFLKNKDTFDKVDLAEILGVKNDPKYQPPYSGFNFTTKNSILINVKNPKIFDSFIRKIKAMKEDSSRISEVKEEEVKKTPLSSDSSPPNQPKDTLEENKINAKLVVQENSDLSNERSNESHLNKQASLDPNNIQKKPFHFRRFSRPTGGFINCMLTQLNTNNKIDEPSVLLKGLPSDNISQADSLQGGDNSIKIAKDPPQNDVRTTALASNEKVHDSSNQESQRFEILPKPLDIL